MIKASKHIILAGIFLSFLLLSSCNLPFSPLRSQYTSLPTSITTSTSLSISTPSPTSTPIPTPIPEFRVESGENALYEGDWESAQAEFSTALEGNPDEIVSIEAELGLIRTSLLQGDMASAISQAELLTQKRVDNDESVTLRDQIAQGFFFLGQAYSNEERFLDAANSFKSYLELKPGLIDGYVYEMIGDNLFSASDYSNAVEAFKSALVSPGLLDRSFLEMKIARSYALSGDSERALSLYDDLFTRTENNDTLALIDWRKGEIFTSLGQIDKAHESFLDAVTRYPTSYYSYSSLLALVEAGIPVDELNRGIVDFFAKEYGAALAAFDRYLNNNPSDPGSAYYYSGLSHNAANRHDLAIQQWNKLIANYSEHPYWDEAWEQKGFTQWFYLDDYPSAINTFSSFAVENPTHPRAAEFLYDAARVAERAGDLEKAASYWRSVSLQYPFDERARNGLFLSGISNYRQGKFSNALQDLEGSLGTSLEPYDRARAYFWIAKTYQSLNEKDKYNEALNAASFTDPTGYYSERAQDLLIGRKPFQPPGMFDLAYDLKLDRDQALDWMNNHFVIDEEKESIGFDELSNEASLQRGEELWNLGLFSEARLEFESLRTAVSDDPFLSFELANYFNELGLYRSATFAARNVLDLSGLDDDSSLFAPIFFNRIRFPTHFEDIIIPASDEFNIHPFLLFSVIRQESLFESFVQSHAAAQGLMQIIPSTGEEIALDLSWPENYQERDLYRPNVNIRFGAHYLAKQLKLFDGDIYSALAAYNGGPGNAAQWKKLSGDDQDLFLEIIRFPETQDYIRRIYEIFSIYRRLYNRTP